MNHPDLDRKHITTEGKAQYEHAATNYEYLAKQIEALQDQKREYLEKMVEIICPYKVGDRLIQQGSAEVEITRILPPKHEGMMSYRLFGRKVKADGSLYKNEHAIWGTTYWELKV